MDTAGRLKALPAAANYFSPMFSFWGKWEERNRCQVPAQGQMFLKEESQGYISDQNEVGSWVEKQAVRGGLGWRKVWRCKSRQELKVMTNTFANLES